VRLSSLCDVQLVVISRLKRDQLTVWGCPVSAMSSWWSSRGSSMTSWPCPDGQCVPSPLSTSEYRWRSTNSLSPPRNQSRSPHRWSHRFLIELLNSTVSHCRLLCSIVLIHNCHIHTTYNWYNNIQTATTLRKFISCYRRRIRNLVMDSVTMILFGVKLRSFGTVVRNSVR